MDPIITCRGVSKSYYRGALDARNAEEVMGLLENLNQTMGKTILLVTHDPKAAHHARVQIHLEKGVLERTVETRHLEAP